MLLCSTAIFLGGGAAVSAQTAGPASGLPNVVDQRPLPQSDRARADEQEAKAKADAEMKRLATEADAKRRADDEVKRVAAEADAKRRNEEDAKRMAADADAKRAADEDVKRLTAEADAKRIAADAAAKQLNAEAEARQRADEESKRLAAATDARRKADEDTKRQAADADTKRLATEAETKRLAAEAEVKRATADAETRRAAAEAETKRRADEDARRTAAAAAATLPPNTETVRLLARGRELVSDGDFEGARLVFDRAAKAGNADAALALADTYDPAVLRRAGAVGVAADPVQATFWRTRAAELRGTAQTASQAAAQVDAQKAAALADQQRQAAAAEQQRQAELQRQAAAAEQQRRAAIATGAAASAARPATPEAQRFIARGRQLLQTGDIEAARGFFERAVSAGSAEAALELGATYDPVALRELGVVGLTADPARATSLYQQALQMGAPGAAERLQRLGAR